jgi:membrane carboxypeptidase/penicillin-binding protein
MSRQRLRAMTVLTAVRMQRQEAAERAVAEVLTLHREAQRYAEACAAKLDGGKAMREQKTSRAESAAEMREDLDLVQALAESHRLSILEVNRTAYLASEQMALYRRVHAERKAAEHLRDATSKALMQGDAQREQKRIDEIFLLQMARKSANTTDFA